MIRRLLSLTHLPGMPDPSPNPPLPLAQRPAWQAVAGHVARIKSSHLRQLFTEDAERFTRFSLRQDGLLLDFTKQRIDMPVWAALHALAAEADLPNHIQQQRSGALLNHSEGRAVLHTALRAPHDHLDAPPEVAASLAQMARFCEQVHSGEWRGFSGERITDVVNLGVGGSDLGPRMAVKALSAWQQPDLRLHFVANIDGADLAGTLAGLNPRSTLFIVTSKTFTTQETMANARTARDWLLSSSHNSSSIGLHFVGVTANPVVAIDFGIHVDQIFPFRDWVGGRFSLWSPVGLSIALAVGFHHFAQLLAGAHAMDQHFYTAAPQDNQPLSLALLTLWNSSFLGITSHAVLPYAQSLNLLPAHLQQLEMESLGKQVNRQGQQVGVPTSPIVWGEAGTNGQHSFYQLLHQGGQPVSADFILVREADYSLPGHHALLLANGLAQSAALAFGQTQDEAHADGCPEHLLPYKTFPGNQPSTTLLLPNLCPFVLGQLIALYEHKVFCLGALWEINAFDQWGVELGKTLANRLWPCLEEAADPSAFDASTRGLIAALRGDA